MADLKDFKVVALGVDNYFTWRERIKAVLEIKDLDHTISAKEPAGGTSSGGTGSASREIKPEEDKRAKGIIKMTVEDILLPIVDKATSARDAWIKLETMFVGEAKTRVLTLKNELNNIKMDPSESAIEYVARGTSLQTKLHAAGHPISEEDVVLALLNGLPADYDNVRTVIFTTGQELTLSKVIGQLMTAESQLRARRGGSSLAAANSGAALMASGSNSNSHSGGYSRSYGKQAAGGKPDSNSSYGGSEYRPECFYCHKKGHKKFQCKKLQADRQAAASGGSRQQPLYSGRQQQQESAFSAVALAANSNSYEEAWVIDSGASHHITPHKAALSNAVALDAASDDQLRQRRQGRSNARGRRIHHHVRAQQRQHRAHRAVQRAARARGSSQPVFSAGSDAQRRAHQL
jgi:hypothetical protein